MTTDKAASGNLAQRIARASAEVGGKLSPDKRNQEQKYDYISSDKILSVIGPVMSENGIVVVPSIEEYVLQVGQSGSGKSRYDASVKFKMTITDGATEMVLPWYGVGNDYSTPDKAIYKAITSGHKYFLAKLFCIGAGNEDGEHEEEKQTVQPRVVKPQPPQPVRNVQAQPPQPQHRPVKAEPAPEFSMSDVGEMDPNPPDDLWKPNEYPNGNGNGKANGKAAKPVEFVWPTETAALANFSGIVFWENLPEVVNRFVGHFSSAHSESGSKSMSTTNKEGKPGGQYGFISSKLDERYGANSHRAILSACCGAVITGDTPPGWKVKELLDILLEPEKYTAKIAQLDEVVKFIKSAEFSEIPA